MRKTLSAHRAFTLVELLVVIGIIALLISILLPALSRARQQANSLKCATQMRGIGQQILMYANANKGFLYPTNAAGDHIGSGVPEDQRWPTYVYNDMMQSGTLNASNHFSPDFLRCPSDDREILDKGNADPYGSYHSYNYQCSLFPANETSKWLKYGGKVPNYDNSDVLLMVEKRQNLHDWHIDVRVGNLAGTKQQWYEVLFNQDPADPGLPDSPRANNKPKYKHGKLGNNYLFLDFSVRNEAPKMNDPAKQGAPHNYYYR